MQDYGQGLLRWQRVAWAAVLLGAAAEHTVTEAELKAAEEATRALLSVARTGRVLFARDGRVQAPPGEGRVRAEEDRRRVPARRRKDRMPHN